MIKPTYLILSVLLCLSSTIYAQNSGESEEEIRSVIGNYNTARDEKDLELLDRILTDDIDQLVSSGTWRKGKKTSMEGMLRSSSNNPGKRTITVEQVRFLVEGRAIADARYEIERSDGTTRKMWSTFILKKENGDWKIAAIRNMLPAK